MVGIICVFVSRPQNQHTKPRLFSPLVYNDWQGPIQTPLGFRVHIDPNDTKEEITAKFDKEYIPTFDENKEVNALMCLSSILVGWAFRHVVGIYTASSESNAVIMDILAMIRTIVTSPNDDHGWVTVKKKRRHKHTSASAHGYFTNMTERIMTKNNWNGIFDVNFYVTPGAVATKNNELIEKVRQKFNERFRKFSKDKEQFDKEVQKFKIFLVLTSY